jgi:hypothetical protein
MAADNSKREVGSEWRAIAQKSGTREFAAAFTANPVLETSVLNGPLVGTAAVEGSLSRPPTACTILSGSRRKTNDGRKNYLEWEGRVFGKDVGGTTILVRDATGLIESIRLYHRPLQVVLEFSKELALRLKGKIDPNLLGASG